MNPMYEKGRKELRAAFWSARSLFIVAAIFSFFINLLMLTGPLFMLQVYDRVLASKSIPTLVALFGLVAGLFAVMGLLDFLRGRILSNAGARFQSLLDGRVFEGTLRRSMIPKERSRPAVAMRDLESIQQFLSGPAPFAFFDAPWTPIYLAAIFAFHSYLGWLALGAALVLMTVALLNQILTAEPEIESRSLSANSEKMAETFRRDAETVRALGMSGVVGNLWGKVRGEALEAQMVHSGRSGLFQTISKTLRMFLQSAVLALGAYLAVLQEITPGVMIAASILMGRALAPVDQAISQWRVFVRARRGAKSLVEFFSTTPVMDARTELPPPTGELVVTNLAVAAPGERTPYVRNVTFSVSPGEAVGVIGPSASGKSTLARALVGLWLPLGGEVRLDGATLDQWSDIDLGRKVGYLPQEVGLFAGTIAQNISRFTPEPDPNAIVEAARRSGAHSLILKLADGYDTQIGDGGAQLSGGQRQRIGLARALFGEACLLVFDEPNSNLDAEGEQALVNAVHDAKKRGCSIIIMAHRPSAIAACDKLLVMRDGVQQAFGPKDEVLKQVTKPTVVGGQQAAPALRTQTTA